MERAIDLDISKITSLNRVWGRRIELLVQIIEAVTIFIMSVLPFGFLCGTLLKIHNIHQSVDSSEADVNAIISF